MRSIHTLLGTAVLGATMALSAPAAHAVVPQVTAACSRATEDARTAEASYNAALADYKATVAGGGHPGQAEQDQLAQDKSDMQSTASEAARVCADAKVPSGTVETGVGSTSQGANSTDIAVGMGMVAAVGAGALVMARRRRGSNQS